MGETDELLRILIQLNGRQAFPEEALRERVGTSARQLAAYNLCDGTRSQAEVIREAKVDQSSFSKAVTRWVNEGILFKLGTGRDVKLLHLYPLSAQSRARE